MSFYLEFLKRECDFASLLCESEYPVLPHELHLQALWFAGQMGREFVTVDGRSVYVVQFGHWNHSAGPDFLHAAVEIDGVLHSGPLELDHKISDWEAHGHAVNQSFNEVVLHVVFEKKGRSHFTRTSDHREVAQVVIPRDVLREALNMPLVSVAHAHPGRCVSPLARMDPIRRDRLMIEAVRHRISLKSRRMSRTVDVLGEDEWLWQVLAETLGYRVNRLPMTLLAQRLPVADLLEMPDVSESVLFGAAGFLTAQKYKEVPSDSQNYLRGLWESWWRVRDDFEPVPARQIPWVFSGIRPVNHPQRRLSCLAMVLRSWTAFKKCSRTSRGVEEYFNRLDHPYWSYHYTLKSKRSNRRLALMGGDRIRDFEMNHLLLPRLAVGDKSAWERYFKIQAPAMSEKVANASLRLFGDTALRKTYLRKAWQHQAILQIYQDFCLRDVSGCLNCPFPEQLAQWDAS